MSGDVTPNEPSCTVHISTPAEAKLCEYFPEFDGEAGGELDGEKTLVQVLALDGAMFVIETDEIDGDSSQWQDDQPPGLVYVDPPLLHPQQNQAKGNS